MLLIAIPKSASTSLFGFIVAIMGESMHYIQTEDGRLWNRKVPVEYKYIYKWHTDIREIELEDVMKVDGKNIFYKQHFPPTSNNLELLDSIKKVILLREPQDVVFAYYRAFMKQVPISFKDSNFSYTMGSDDWYNVAKRLGVVEDVERFYDGWNSYK